MSLGGQDSTGSVPSVGEKAACTYPYFTDSMSSFKPPCKSCAASPVMANCLCARREAWVRCRRVRYLLGQRPSSDEKHIMSQGEVHEPQRWRIAILRRPGGKESRVEVAILRPLPSCLLPAPSTSWMRPSFLLR
jgi:hypothetical protein